jgi:hypothetical protein
VSDFDRAVSETSDEQIARLTEAFPDPARRLACVMAAQAIYKAATEMARQLRPALGSDADEVVRVALREAALTADISHAYHRGRTAS